MTKEGDQDQQLTIRISAERIALLDEIRRREKDLPTRAAMLRRLVDDAARLRNIGGPVPKTKSRSWDTRPSPSRSGSHVRSARTPK